MMFREGVCVTVYIGSMFYLWLGPLQRPIRPAMKDTEKMLPHCCDEFVAGSLHFQTDD